MFIVSAVEIVYCPENVYRNVVFLQDVAVGSWQLQLRHSEADDAESKAHYKFHRSLQMKAHTFCTVSLIFVTYIEKNMFVGVLKLVIILSIYFNVLIFFHAKPNLNLNMSAILMFIFIVILF